MFKQLFRKNEIALEWDFCEIVVWNSVERGVIWETSLKVGTYLSPSGQRSPIFSDPCFGNGQRSHDTARNICVFTRIFIGCNNDDANLVKLGTFLYLSQILKGLPFSYRNYKVRFQCSIQENEGCFQIWIYVNEEGQTKNAKRGNSKR